ncbi:MAG: hypothetical protein RL662_1008 [Bacteroidota bacterium]|jgi:serine/threonine protein phosphatase PrpC
MMNVENYIAYLSIAPDEADKLKAFFETDEVKTFLIDKWGNFNLPPTILIEQSVQIDAPEPVSLPEQEPVNNQLNHCTMPTIPNIPDDDETRANKRVSKYDDPKDEALDQKLKSKFIQLQNGKVNQAYAYLFDITLLDIVDIGDFWFEGLEELGLRFNRSTDRIEGIPTQAGDFKIVLKCKRSIWTETVFERPITLIINPDPRSLWNNTPTPVDIPYYRPDSDCAYVKVEKSNGFLGFGKKDQKDMVAASQRGRSHAHEGNARDDDFRLAQLCEGNWYIMAVADGAGSAKYARQGANIACNTVSEICQTQLSKYNKEVDELIKDFDKERSDAKRKKLGDALYNIIGSAVFKAYKNIEKEAADSGSQVKDYATTFLVSIAKKFRFGWFIATFWVGDGGIGIYHKETGYLKIMGEPDGGEFAGQTRFLTMPEVMQPAEIYKRLRFEIVDDFTALILMTDGVTDPKFETDANLAKIEKWNELWDDLSASVMLTDDNEAAADQLLKWLDFWSPGNHDDRTIAILY